MPGARCTPTSTAGHAASNCTLPPKIVHGVDHATTGMVRPVHVCCGVVFRQPQSTVLMAYQPGASGVPVFSPTVSPGCVTEPARAGAAVQSDRKPAVTNFVPLLFICEPPSPPRRRQCGGPFRCTHLVHGRNAMPDGDRVRAIVTAPRTSIDFFGNCCRNAGTPLPPFMALVHHANCRTFPAGVPS